MKYLGALLVISACLLKPCNLYANEPSGLWNVAEFSVYKDNDYEFEISQEDRWNQNFNNYIYSESKLKLTRKLLDWLKVGISESFIRNILDERDDTFEARHTLEITPSCKNEYFTSAYRFRLEMREISDDQQGTIWNSRHRLQLTGSADYFGAVRPVASTEVYYNLSDETVDQNRTFYGIQFNLFEKLTLSLQHGYVSQKKDSDWDSPQVFFISFKSDYQVL